MKHSLSRIILFIFLSFPSLESFGQQILGMDTAVVDVLAIFYCSGDRNAVEKNYFGMVLLDGASGIDKLLPTAECGYQYYKSNHNIVNRINNIINKYYIANIRLGNDSDMSIFLWLLNKEFIPYTPSTWRDSRKKAKAMEPDTTSVFYYLRRQLYNNQQEIGYVNRENCYSDPFMLWNPPYNEFDYKEGYFYQLHKYRMAYLLIQDENDSILRLAYYNPLQPIMFPKNYYDIISPAGEPITFTDEYAVHIRRYEKDGVSLVAIPYLFDYIATHKEKRKERRKERRLEKSKSKNFIIIL